MWRVPRFQEGEIPQVPGTFEARQHCCFQQDLNRKRCAYEYTLDFMNRSFPKGKKFLL